MIFSLWLNSPSASANTAPHSPSDAKPHLSQAIEHIQHQHYSRALESLNRAVELDPASAEAYGDRCLVSVELGNYPRAVSDCLRAAQLEPNRTNTYLHLGVAYYRSGDFTNAIAAFDRLLELQPGAALGYYNRGLVYSELEDYQRAIADYDRALDLNESLEPPELAEIFIDRGVAYLMGDQIPDAIANFSEAIQRDETNPRAHYNQACACSRQGNTEAAIAEFNVTLALNPDHALAHFNRAMLRQQRGLYAGAIADLEAACKCFAQQGNPAASRHTLALMEKLQQWLISSEFQIVA